MYLKQVHSNSKFEFDDCLEIDNFLNVEMAEIEQPNIIENSQKPSLRSGLLVTGSHKKKDLSILLVEDSNSRLLIFYII